VDVNVQGARAGFGTAQGTRSVIFDRWRQALRVIWYPYGRDGVLNPCLSSGYLTRRLPAETARWSTITQIYEDTSQIRRMVMARQLLK
jgi:hypothetical protein